MGADNRFEHILYEIEMFLDSYRCLDNPDRNQHNMAADALAIHLRSLAFFFRAEKSLGKGRSYWHVADVVVSTSSLRLIDDDSLFEGIQHYTSNATGHLLDDRLEESFKPNTDRCYRKAIPLIVAAIEDYLNQAPAIVKPDLRVFWEESYIQETVLRVRSLLQVTNERRLGATGTSS